VTGDRYRAASAKEAPMRSSASFALALLSIACSAGKDLGPSPSRVGDGGLPAGDVGGFGGEPEAPISEDGTCAAASARASRPPVDLIFTVDQSGSMNDDIANVKANINKLAAFLDPTGLDYRVIVIASFGAPVHTSAESKPYEVCVPPPLGGPSCGAPNPPRFRQINRNVQSRDSLKIILATYDSADPKLAWRGDLRPEALKVFVPITDDDSTDYSKVLGVTCTREDYLRLSSDVCNPEAPRFDEELLGKPGGQFGTPASRGYVFYPIVGAAAYPSERVCGDVAENPGKQYLELAKLTKGRWFPICSKDFGPVFQQIAKDVVTRVACELPIPAPPAGTLDLDRVNVSWTPAKGSRTRIAQDPSKPCGGGADGWQYDASRTKVLSCGKACADVRADPVARIDVEFGCKTIVR
jgi:hypothetical protein